MILYLVNTYLSAFTLVGWVPQRTFDNMNLRNPASAIPEALLETFEYPAQPVVIEKIAQLNQ